MELMEFVELMEFMEFMELNDIKPYISGVHYPILTNLRV